jgi:hypothetical protein
MPNDYRLTDNSFSTLGDKAKSSFDKTLKALGDQPMDSSADDMEITGLVADILAKYERAKTERLPHEQRWLRQYHNFRGLYQADTQFRDTEQSKAFVKITKTKVMAAYANIIDVLFQSDKFPLSVEPTDKPQGIEEYAHLEPGNPSPEPEVSTNTDVIGWFGDGKEIAPGTTYFDLLGGLNDKYEGAELIPGPAPDLSKMPQIKPAEEAAQNMEKTILDQISQSDGHIWLRKAIFEMCLLGQGTIKGPFTTEKCMHNWKKDKDSGERTYEPIYEKVPAISHVSTWNFFPDPDAKIMKEAEWCIERHKLSRSQLRALSKRPFFRGEAITRVCDNIPNYVDQWWEYELRDSPVNVSRRRYEVIEYWGIVDKQLIESTGLDLGIDIDDLDEVQVNVWLCNHEILRCVINPFTPAYIPYHSCPYEEHEYQMWGIGVAENMEDSQDIMNAFARLAIDNAALASNLVFDVDETSLVPGQDFKMYPGKVFRREAGSPGQAVFGLKFPNIFPDAMNVFDKFRQLADESTGIPSIMHGQTGVTGTGRTAAGLSMLMGNADKNIKAVIRNIDDFILQPLGEGMFNWNMQFNEDDSIFGDLDIKARGTSGLMAKEIKSQRLMQFLQTVSNPMLAPFVKFEHIVRDIAISMDIDPDDYINDPTMAMIYAQMIGMAGGVGQSGSPPQMDMSGVGGGQVGTGSAPQPGTPGHSANTGSSSNAESANA